MIRKSSYQALNLTPERRFSGSDSSSFTMVFATAAALFESTVRPFIPIFGYLTSKITQSAIQELEFKR